MFSEDILDGWLSMPLMGDLLEEQPTIDPEHQLQAAVSTWQLDRDDITIPALRSLDSELEVQKQIPPVQPDSTTGGIAARKRRGHTKSRLGCTSCKRRKIKCQEQWPSCANCIKRGFTCRYPTVFQHAQHDRIVSEVMHSQSPRQIARLADTPTMYSANDMQLFHHFMIAAHPCIPLAYSDVWVKDVPVFSHKYDYLMSSLLALSGSHLALLTDGPYNNIALLHRQKAITGLEEAFTRWPPHAEEAHVMLASSYLLGFQSSYMPDAFLDHLISLRGCSLISQKILESDLTGCFSVTSDMSTLGLGVKLRKTPFINQALAREALQSLAQLSPLLYEAHPIEKALFAQVVACVRPLVVYDSPRPPSTVVTPELSEASTVGTSDSDSDSPYEVPDPLPHINHPLFPAELAVTYEEVVSEGFESIAEVPPTHLRPDPLRSFQGLMSALLVLTTWPQDQLLHLLSPNNELGNLVMAHFNVVRFLISPLSAPDDSMRTPIKAMIEWTERKLQRAEDDGDIKWSKYGEWPAKIVRTLRQSIDRKRGFSFADLYNIVTRDPEAFLEGRLARL